MKKAAAIFGLIASLLSFTACSLSIVNNFTLRKSKSFTLEILNLCDSDIYGYHFEYFLNEEPIGGRTITNADEGRINKKETVINIFTENEFPENADLREFQIEIYVLNEDFRESEASNLIDMAVDYGEKYQISVSGSFTEGFQISPE